MSSLPLLPHFCSAMLIVAPLLRCAIQSAVAALGLAALSYQPSIHHFPTRSIHHLPTNITTSGLTILCCWLWFFYRESFATTHRNCRRRRRTRCLRCARRERGRALECQGTIVIVNGSTILRNDKRDATQTPERNNHTHIGSDYDKPRAQSTAMQNDAHSSPSCIQTR